MKVLRDSDMMRRNSPFEVLGGSDRLQIGLMVLQPGETSGPYGNEHPESDQALYVVEGRCEVLVEGTTVELAEDDVLHIGAGERHQVKCSGEIAVRTLNLYGPKAY